MALLDRLVSSSEGEVKLPVHQFISALAEYKRGEINGQRLATWLELSASEITQLGLVIPFFRARTEFHFFNLYLLLFLLSSLTSFVLLELKFTEVHQSANGWIRLR